MVLKWDSYGIGMELLWNCNGIRMGLELEWNWNRNGVRMVLRCNLDGNMAILKWI